MKKIKKTPEQELALRAGEAAAAILKCIDVELAIIEANRGWTDELVERLAQREHRRDYKAYGVQPWSIVGKTAKAKYRRRAKDTLKAIARFVEEKKRKLEKRLIETDGRI